MLSEPRLKLLRGLNDVEGGCLPAEWLTVPTRRLATRMQRDGLVQWKAPPISSRHTCAGQTLYITPAGRAALSTTGGRANRGRRFSGEGPGNR